LLTASLPNDHHGRPDFFYLHFRPYANSSSVESAVEEGRGFSPAEGAGTGCVTSDIVARMERFHIIDIHLGLFHRSTSPTVFKNKLAKRRDVSHWRLRRSFILNTLIGKFPLGHHYAGP
jgi:hypothetical protein